MRVDGEEFVRLDEEEGGGKALAMMMSVQQEIDELIAKLGMGELKGNPPGIVITMMAACLGVTYAKAAYFAENVMPFPSGWKGTDKEINDIAETFVVNATLSGIEPGEVN